MWLRLFEGYVFAPFLNQHFTQPWSYHSQWGILVHQKNDSKGASVIPKPSWVPYIPMSLSERISALAGGCSRESHRKSKGPLVATRAASNAGIKNPMSHGKWRETPLVGREST